MGGNLTIEEYLQNATITVADKIENANLQIGYEVS